MDLFTFSWNTGNLLGDYPKAFSRLYNYEVFSFDSSRMSAKFLSVGAGNQGAAFRHCLCYLNRYRCTRGSCNRYYLFQRTGNLTAFIFYHAAADWYYRFKSYFRSLKNKRHNELIFIVSFYFIQKMLRSCACSPLHRVSQL